MRRSVVVSCAHVGQQGAVSPCGRLVESRYSRLVCLALGPELTKRGIDWTLIEESLGTGADGPKVRAVNLAAPDLAIEPHLNAAVERDRHDRDHDGDLLELVPAPDRGGHMVVYDAGSVRGKALAGAVSAALAAALPGRRVIGAQSAPGPWVHRTEPLPFLHDTTCPAVIPELLHVTNPGEVEWLLRPDSPAVLAEALASGIVAWLDDQAAGKVA